MLTPLSEKNLARPSAKKVRADKKFVTHVNTVQSIIHFPNKASF